MSWSPPPLPRRSHDEFVAYWRTILTIPLSEKGAAELRFIAAQRLLMLRDMSELEARRFPDPWDHQGR